MAYRRIINQHILKQHLAGAHINRNAGWRGMPAKKRNGNRSNQISWQKRNSGIGVGSERGGGVIIKRQ